MDYHYKYFDEIDSTNNYIKREIAKNSPLKFPFVAVAKSQTAGRGRLEGRSFFSPPGGLYFSCAFTAGQIACKKGLITLGAGVAVARAAEKLAGGVCTLKWVNDVLRDGKKVCGILCESVYSQSERCYVYVVGIGVNTSASAVGGFMTSKVGALGSILPDSMLAEILSNLSSVYGDEDNGFLREYNARLGICGKQVDILHDGSAVAATVVGATDRGLECSLTDGRKLYVQTSDEIVTDIYALS